MSVLVSKVISLSALLMVSLQRLPLFLFKPKRLLTGCLSFFLVASLWLTTTTFAWAETPVALFKVHCAGCHPNGANIIRRGKNLKQKALKRYGYDSVDAIATLITHGKGLMSAYGDQLSEDDIIILAHYVLEQAAVNWKPTK